jgi:F-type H+-transporting ATPase subunit epsilon
MSASFNLNIFTAGKTIYTGQVCSLIAPAESGYLGVLANHAPLITTLVAGKIILREMPDKLTTIYSEGKGFLQVFKNEATLLLDSVS